MVRVPGSVKCGRVAPEHRFAAGARRRFVFVLLIGGALVLAGACSGKGHGGAPNSEQERIEPIEECQQYESMLANCFHRETTFANQEALFPKSKADRERIRAL